MSRIFITGSADGLGQLAARHLAEQGHRVVVHGRNEERASEALRSAPGAEAVVVGDLGSIAQTRSIADQVNNLGDFDVVIHNAGIYRETRQIETEDGLPRLFAVNMLAPYILTALIKRPKRLIYLSSSMHRQADTQMDDLLWKRRRWNDTAAYCETKFQDVLLAFAVARLYPGTLSNAVDPGWVPTKMGGAGAPDNLEDGYRTQAWLATSGDPAALVAGQYFHHQRAVDPNPAARDIGNQDRLLAECRSLTGLSL